MPNPHQPKLADARPIIAAPKVLGVEAQPEGAHLPGGTAYDGAVRGKWIDCSELGERFIAQRSGDRAFLMRGFPLPGGRVLKGRVAVAKTSDGKLSMHYMLRKDGHWRFSIAKESGKPPTVLQLCEFKDRAALYPVRFVRSAMQMLEALRVLQRKGEPGMSEPFLMDPLVCRKRGCTRPGFPEARGGRFVPLKTVKGLGLGYDLNEGVTGIWETTETKGIIKLHITARRGLEKKCEKVESTLYYSPSRHKLKSPAENCPYRTPKQFAAFQLFVAGAHTDSETILMGLTPISDEERARIGGIYTTGGEYSKKIVTLYGARVAASLDKTHVRPIAPGQAALVFKWTAEVGHELKTRYTRAAYSSEGLTTFDPSTSKATPLVQYHGRINSALAFRALQNTGAGLVCDRPVFPQNYLLPADQRVDVSAGDRLIHVVNSPQQAVYYALTYGTLAMARGLSGIDIVTTDPYPTQELTRSLRVALDREGCQLDFTIRTIDDLLARGISRAETENLRQNAWKADFYLANGDLGEMEKLFTAVAGGTKFAVPDSRRCSPLSIANYSEFITHIHLKVTANPRETLIALKSLDDTYLELLPQDRQEQLLFLISILCKHFATGTDIGDQARVLAAKFKTLTKQHPIEQVWQALAEIYYLRQELRKSDADMPVERGGKNAPRVADDFTIDRVKVEQFDGGRYMATIARKLSLLRDRVYGNRTQRAPLIDPWGVDDSRPAATPTSGTGVPLAYSTGEPGGLLRGVPDFISIRSDIPLRRALRDLKHQLRSAGKTVHAQLPGQVVSRVVAVLRDIETSPGNHPNLHALQHGPAAASMSLRELSAAIRKVEMQMLPLGGSDAYNKAALAHSLTTIAELIDRKRRQ